MTYCDMSLVIGQFSYVIYYPNSLLFRPLGTDALYQKQFIADESVELVRAGRILGKTAYAFAVAGFSRIQGLRRFKTLLGFSEPVHFQTQQSELVMGFTKL